MKNKFILICLLVMGISLPLFAQPFADLLRSVDKHLNFDQQAVIVNKFYDTARGSNRSGYKQWKRWEWFISNHLGEDGKPENYAEKNWEAAEIMKASFNNNNPNTPLSNSGTWINTGYSGVSNAGSTPRQGRVNCIAFDPFNANTIYAGTAGGGLWKSYNQGLSWTSLAPNIPSMTISSLTVAPDGNTLYATTGDGFLPTFIPGSPYIHSGIGIIKSTDGGLSWQKTGPVIQLDSTYGGSKIRIHPTNSNVVVAALSNGLWISRNNGISWKKLLDGNIADFEFKPNDADLIYVSKMQNNLIYFLDLVSEIYTTKLITTQRSVKRIEIGVTPANPQAIYLLVGPGYSGGGAGTPGGTAMYNGLYFSPDAGINFFLRNNNVDIFALNADQSWYDIVIHVNPSDANDVVIGGVRLYRSINGGNIFTELNTTTSPNLHADNHGLERNPVDGSLYLGDDGGVFRSTDNGASWTTLGTNLIINEFYRIAGYQLLPDLLLGGTQDNGQFIRSTNSQVFFGGLMGLDGMDNIIDRTNASIQYACSQNGGLYKSVNGGVSFTALSIAGGGGNWITPIVQMPSDLLNNTLLYGGSAGIFRSVDGGSNWANIGGQSSTDCLSLGTDGANFNLYTSSGSQMQFSSNPTATTPSFVTRTTPNSSTKISAIAVNPYNMNEVWFTCSGYSNGNKVYRSFNAGITWGNYSLSLPNIPVYCIAFGNPSNSPGGAVYIGTELGVFYKDDNLLDWEPYYNGMPMLPVTDLFVNYNANRIYAATFGRGIWQSDLYTSCSPGPLFLSGTVLGKYFFQTSTYIESTQQLPNGIGNDLRLRAPQLILLKPGFYAGTGTYLHIVNGNCSTGVVSMPADSTAPNRPNSNPLIPIVRKE